MQPERVRPLSESDIDFVVAEAGGVRAHPDADRRKEQGADYRIGSALIELKALDDEGFSKPERQVKLAELFRKHHPGRPVIVLDRGSLPTTAQPLFDRIVEGPVKSGVAKAKQQLRQSRKEFPDCNCSVLMVINNGYTTLSHDALRSLVVRRAKNDTSEIDAVVVAGAYYHSDGFDSYFLWPIDAIQLNVDRKFEQFESLRNGWNALAGRYMNDLMQGKLGSPLAKGPIADTSFTLDGITFVRPAPAIGEASQFFVHGRPRENSSGLVQCPPVATTFPRPYEAPVGKL